MMFVTFSSEFNHLVKAKKRKIKRNNDISLLELYAFNIKGFRLLGIVFRPFNFHFLHLRTKRIRMEMKTFCGTFCAIYFPI